MNFLGGKDVLLEKDLPEKVTTIKRFEYLPLDSELKNQTDIAKNNITDQTRFIGLIMRMMK